MMMMERATKGKIFKEINDKGEQSHNRNDKDVRQVLHQRERGF
jgi:hypothetical protein